MKNLNRLSLLAFLCLLVLPALLFFGCSSSARTPASDSPVSDRPVGDRSPASTAGTSFSDIEGKEWTLLELRRAGESIVMNRQQIEADGLTGAYTLSFADGMVRGKAAPNGFSGPYSIAHSPGGNELSIGLLASTMMFSFIQPEGLNENEFFALLSAVNRWDLREGRLELYSSAAGAEAVLVFAE